MNGTAKELYPLVHVITAKTRHCDCVQLRTASEITVRVINNELDVYGFMLDPVDIMCLSFSVSSKTLQSEIA